ncbi:MAG: 4-hydroxy-3-methylbut-2-enyl diphosphate reductase [Pseudomonadota bacterium]
MSVCVSSVKEATAPPAVIVRLAAPRGFCAGVERAVRTVEEALSAFGAPVFVRHEIVHNAHVVNRLKSMGAVFVEDLAEVEEGRPVIFSAHGAPRTAYDEANARALLAIDATCPLVLKVHNEVRRHAASGRHVILIGHAGHPETIGTMGHAPRGAVTLIETVVEAEQIAPPGGPLAYATQTTLSVNDAAAIIAVLKRRFPAIEGPRRSDICYATQNRQEAVKLISPGADVVFVVGSPQSSNSVRLVEAALSAGAAHALLVDDPALVDLSSFESAKIIGVTSGASAPEYLVEALLKRLAERRPIKIETVEHVREEIVFKQPMLMAS